MKRVFLIVLDSFGIGAMEDAASFGDEGTNTLKTVAGSPYFSMEQMGKLGLFHIDGVEKLKPQGDFSGVIARMKEASAGKDTTIGHWEIAGIYSRTPLPTYPNGFPPEVLEPFCQAVGREVLCNRPYSGTEVIKDYGEEHVQTGKLIVYTSGDSVFQIAAHEDVVPVEELYQICEKARAILVGKHGVGRVIARPFTGEVGNFVRTKRRHDFSLQPPGETMLDLLKNAGYATIGVGKISDIFAGRGISKSYPTGNNKEGIETLLARMEEEFTGLCFVNLVDFDMLYGHRNDVDGYAKALTEFDQALPDILGAMREEDLLMITADHGCDPGYQISTDHSREHTPFVMVGKNLSPKNLGTRETFADIGATVLQYFGICPADFYGKGMLEI